MREHTSSNLNCLFDFQDIEDPICQETQMWIQCRWARLASNAYYRECWYFQVRVNISSRQHCLQRCNERVNWIEKSLFATLSIYIFSIWVTYCICLMLLLSVVLSARGLLQPAIDDPHSAFRRYISHQAFEWSYCRVHLWAQRDPWLHSDKYNFEKLVRYC